MTITRQFGAQAVSGASSSALTGSELVLALLKHDAKVDTGDGGRVVTGIDGLKDSTGPRPLEWSYYINGVQGRRLASKALVYSGDHVWFDLHDPRQAPSHSNVVGAFPEPFLNGNKGRRWPITIQCGQAGSSPCETIAADLHNLGVVAGIAAPVASFEPEILHVAVGPWSTVAGLPAVHQLTEGPRGSGVYAAPSRSGTSLALLNQEGETVRTLGSGWGLVAAVGKSGEAPVWIVTGGDEAGVELAAKAFNEHALHDHFALAVTATETIPLPVG